MGARAVGPWVGEQKPLGKYPLRGNPSPELTYLPTYLNPGEDGPSLPLLFVTPCLLNPWETRQGD